MSVGLVRQLLGTACGVVHWIPDAGSCRQLVADLQGVALAQQRGATGDAKTGWRSFLNDLDAQHGPGKPVSDNAYWLLRVNANYMASQL